jgi:hypothetical protein
MLMDHVVFLPMIMNFIVYIIYWLCADYGMCRLDDIFHRFIYGICTIIAIMDHFGIFIYSSTKKNKIDT